MLLVVDANVLFAVAIKSGGTAELLFSENIELVTPEFIFEELEKHKAELIKKSHRSVEEFEIFLSILLEKVKPVSLEDIKELANKAESISPDPKDVPYFALALKLGCPIWSNDSVLKKQSLVKVFSTRDLLSVE